MSKDDFTAAVDRLVDASIQVRQKWNELFGASFSETWSDPRAARKELLYFANEWMNKPDRRGYQNRSGQMSLFIRENISDRLYLEQSTESALNENPGPDYIRQERFLDKARGGVPFYQLYDRLRRKGEALNSPDYQKARGFTGWVAVTGIPLAINGDRTFRSQLFNVDQKNVLDKYGPPAWAGNVSEFRDASKSEDSFLNICVPVWDPRSPVKAGAPRVPLEPVMNFNLYICKGYGT